MAESLGTRPMRCLRQLASWQLTVLVQVCSLTAKCRVDHLDGELVLVVAGDQTNDVLILKHVLRA